MFYMYIHTQNVCWWTRWTEDDDRIKKLSSCSSPVESISSGILSSWSAKEMTCVEELDAWCFQIKLLKTNICDVKPPVLCAIRFTRVLSIQIVFGSWTVISIYFAVLFSHWKHHLRKPPFITTVYLSCKIWVSRTVKVVHLISKGNVKFKAVWKQSVLSYTLLD